MTTSPTIAVDLRALVPQPTGIGIYTRSMLFLLGRRGKGHYIGMAHKAPHYETKLREVGLDLETQRAPLGVLWQQLQLPRRLARGDIDLLWSPINTLPLHCPVPGVVTVHDLTVRLFPHTHSLKVRLSTAPFLRPTLRRAAAIVADSEATAADLRRFYPFCADRLHVIYPGVDPNFRPASRGEIRAIRQELGCPQGYLLYAGTLEPRKNVGRVLDAWEELRKSRPALPLLLTGSPGWRNSDLRRRIASLEPFGLRYLGRVERQQLVRIFQGALAFIYPSLYEGFGLPPAEAMACGIPVITSNVSSLPEVVGDAGIQVAPDDVEGMALGLARILGERGLAEDLRERGLERVQRFSWLTAAQQLEKVFFGVLG